MTGPTVDGQLDALRREIRQLRLGLLVVAVLLGVCVGRLTFEVAALAGTETPAATPTVSPATSTPDSDVLRGLRAERLRDRPVSRSSPRPVSMDIRIPTITATEKRHGDPTVAQWTALRDCESDGDYRANTGNGYYGAYQGDVQTWDGFDGYARPDLAPAAVQDRWALTLYHDRGSQPWPYCGRYLR